MPKAFFYGGNKINKYFRLNDRIQAKELRVIGPDGTQIGVIAREEALAKAKELGLDLIEVAATANPPVARILDFQKFRYEENKREQAAKKNAKDVELKELWFTPRIAEHDLQTRLRRVEEFLKDGNRIMIRVKFTGREMWNMQPGYKVIEKILGVLGDKIAVERETKQEGRSLTMIIGKSKQK